MIAVRALSPSTIRPPLARYSHGIAVPADHRLVITAGQLGIGLDESIPADSEGQANLCFANIAAILAEDRMTMADVVRLSV
jgi:enamine deaminase RidA (YjgF/YER057c/UK114 family)